MVVSIISSALTGTLEGKAIDGEIYREIVQLTLRKTNVVMENGPGLKMYFLLKKGTFQPAMLVYQRVYEIPRAKNGTQLQSFFQVIGSTEDFYFF